MVEEVQLQEEQNKVLTDNQRKNLVIGFYVWNLNLYLVSLITFSNFWMILLLFILTNTLVFRKLFGFQRGKRTLLFTFVLWGIYIYSFNGFIWQYLLLGITTLINIQYYLFVVKDGKILDKNKNTYKY
ncbi:MAG: hypothetical protein ACOC56_02110 [Atribacterota bacterium]